MRAKPRPGWAAWGLAIAMAASHPSSSRADWLDFAGGGRAQVRAERSGREVIVETRTGRYRFDERDFRKIVPGGDPEAEWPGRSESALRGGAAERFHAAWWALENGLVPEAVAMLRQAHRADPAHQPTARLVATLDRLERPRADPDTEGLRRALGVACQEERGPRVLLLHQHDRAEARARVDLLERVAVAYYLTMTAQGFDLAVPDHRLVSVHLRDRSDYLSFLEHQGAGAFRTTLGYYHPNLRAVITFDEGEGGGVPARIEGRDRPGDLERRRLLADLDRLARVDGTAAHELIHLLVVESGLAPVAGAFPLWLHEGFAAQFEVIRGGRWAGIGRVHDLRLPDWRALSAPASLGPLIQDGGFGRGYRGDLYAKSWALVYFLRKTRPEDFAAYLDLLRSPVAECEPGDPKRFDALFRSAFGDDLTSLEQQWRGYMSRLRTPMDEHAAEEPRAARSFRRHRD